MIFVLKLYLFYISSNKIVFIILGHVENVLQVKSADKHGLNYNSLLDSAEKEMTKVRKVTDC